MEDGLVKHRLVRIAGSRFPGLLGLGFRFMKFVV